MNPSGRELLLAIDVGNSRYKFGLFDVPRSSRGGRSHLSEGGAVACSPPSQGGAGGVSIPAKASQPVIASNAVPSANAPPAAIPGIRQSLPVCLDSFTCPANVPLPWAQLVTWATQRNSTCVAAIVAGANPAGISTLRMGWPDVWPAPTIIEGPGALPLSINLPAPEKVGIDRLLNAVAANRLRAEGQPVIIVDTGTATTVDYVSASGAFEGGAILPGFQLCAASLHEYTALLPLVEVDELSGPPPAALGRSTREAIRSGLFWGQVGAVKELISQLESRANPQALLVVTGGAAPLLGPHLKTHIDPGPYLPLQGLALVAEGC